MPKKDKILTILKNKTDKIIHDEIDKIIKVTEEQNLAIRKILENKNNIFKQKEEVWKKLNPFAIIVV